MAEYLTENAYMRWFRQYQTNLGYYMDLLDYLRLRLDSLPFDEDAELIENRINEIDEKLEKVIPRIFTDNGKPLAGHEIFLENVKVLINLILKLFGRPGKFAGVYHDEKIRVLKVHQEFRFKDKLKQVREMIEVLEAKYAKEYTGENPPEPAAVEGQQP